MAINVIWLKLIETLLPVLAAAIPGIPPALIPVLIAAMKAAETAGSSGPDKKAAVIAEVGKTKTAVDTTALSQLIDHTIDAANKVANIGLSHLG